MYFIVLESQTGTSTEKRFNDVHWLAVHSFFDYHFHEQLICVLKPHHGSHEQAKIFFREKVTIPTEICPLEIDGALATPVDCQEEDSLSASRTRVLHLADCPTNVESVSSELGMWLKVKINYLADNASSRLSITACHEEVLDEALSRINQMLKYASADLGNGTGRNLTAMAVSDQSRQRQDNRQQPSIDVAASAAPAAAVASASTTTIGPKRQRKPLFPEAFEDSDETLAPPVPPQQQQQQQQQQLFNNSPATPSTREFKLGQSCSLIIDCTDLTKVTDADLVVATTNASLSVKHGLANALALRDGRQGMSLVESDCQHFLKSLKGRQLQFGDSYLCQAGQILFLVLPNDRRLEGQLGRGREFRKTMDSCLLGLMKRLPGLGYRRVAMPTLGSTLSLWSDGREWSEALAAALGWLAGGSGAVGQLRELRVCCVSDEAVRLLGDAVARQPGVAATGGGDVSRAANTAPASMIGASNTTHQQQQHQANAAREMEVDDDESGLDDSNFCLICCEHMSPENPAVPFHCDQDGRYVCARCVTRLGDPTAPSDGKCVLCLERYRPAVGNQPADGRMIVSGERHSLPGHEDCGTIVIRYEFDAGLHENVTYKGTTRTAYLPDNPGGQAILKRLQAAFDGRVVFNIGQSATTGHGTAITWNTVHHKTNKNGGASRHGYPDDGYLQRVSDELSSLGY